MSDQKVRTVIRTEAGELELQKWFVRDGQKPPALGVRFEGAEKARPAAGLPAILREADLVVIGPSNPVISVEPILAVLGRLLNPRRTEAVSPIVGGRALKGPTMEMLESLGRDATPFGVAAGYRQLLGRFVLDERDAGEADRIAGLGLKVTLADTVMADEPARIRLAQTILAESL
jgi:LPPG:FO 2-phospho-L-lactate transferase